ncbi:MAG: DUF1848 domain-containing protein [Eubacteriales bacterium]|nr:DUF1848 domain-containing protein [Eubacteriales bacterium]
MILSVSRRTDIPNYYSDWFYNRIKEGFLYVRNPMNIHQISRIDLSPQVVDCIVFWTKNPEPMMERLEELGEYDYYFQFTLTGYGRDIEPGIPRKRTEVIETFQRLSEKTGKSRIIWRYDPILFNDRYTEEYHIRAFEEIAGRLKNYTDKVVISFMDMYVNTQNNAGILKPQKLNQEQTLAFAQNIADAARKNGMSVETCAEQIDLSRVGIRHGACIDKNLIEKILGCRLKIGKDKNQRGECGCFESIDVGTYNTCRNGCKYCYADFDHKTAKENIRCYDPDSPLLCQTVGPGDQISHRKVRSLKDGQIHLFDSNFP